MPEIQLIDLVIFPDWCGGDYVMAYIEPQTGKRDYFSTWASEELITQWQQRAEEVQRDPTRMLVHLRDAHNSSDKVYLIDFARSLDDLEPTKRYISVNGHHIETGDLAGMAQNLGLVFTPEIRIVGYGHHRGDCVPERGRKATQSLGLDACLFEELSDLSVGDKVMDRLDIVRQENLSVFWHYSDDHLEQLRKEKQFDTVCSIISAWRYLFLYCTAEQVREAARNARSVADFEKRIGGTFQGFNFSEDYVRLCQKHGYES